MHRIVLGITGGIAAYKAPDIVRRLMERGSEVRVVMTSGACEFITALSLQAVSGQPVHRDLLDERAEAGMGHIELARWGDAILVAPATAHCMAKLAGGHASDLLSTICLATTSPIVLAPAMNQQMWQAPATQSNLRTLLERGVRVLGPGVGSQACGEVGPGRMLEPIEIVTGLIAFLEEPKRGGTELLLDGLHVLVTAGPTREAIDPVRYISNNSSGKMGYAVAAEAAALGARVTLVSGPTGLGAPDGVARVDVTTASEMYDAVVARAPKADVFVAAAAVADYTPRDPAGQKIKKSANQMAIELSPTRDILAAVACMPNAPFTVGFAAETNDMRANSQKKLEGKALDMIAGNDVADPRIGFNSEENALTVLWNGGGVELPRAPKTSIARQLLELVAARYHAKKDSTSAPR